MHITCDRCRTTYALDDRLIPAAGAPVQCTRCGAVFTVKPAAAAAAAVPDTHKTMMMFPGQKPGATPSPAVANATAAEPSASVDTSKTLIQFRPFPAASSAAPQSPKPESPTRRPAEVRTSPKPAVQAPSPSPPATTPRRTPVAQPMAPEPRAALQGRTPPAQSAPAAPSRGPSPSHVVGAATARTRAPLPASPPLGGPTPLPGVSAGEAETETPFERDIARRRKRTVVVLVALGVVALAAVTVAVLRGRTPLAPADAVRAHDEALDKMKRDDDASLRAAAEDFARIAAQYPTHVPSIADRAVVLAIELADLRDEIRVADSAYVKLDRERASIEEKKATPDWRARVEAKIADLREIKAKTDPLKDRAEQLSKELNEALRRAQERAKSLGVEDPSVLRANAMSLGLKGDDRAEAVANEYRRAMDPARSLNDPNRAFADLAVAAMAANGPHTPERMAKGLKAADDAVAKDAQLVRARFFVAKIRLAQKAYAEVRATLDAVLLQNPQHDAAKRLLDEVKAAEAAAAAKPPAPPP